MVSSTQRAGLQGSEADIATVLVGMHRKLASIEQEVRSTVSRAEADTNARLEGVISRSAGDAARAEQAAARCAKTAKGVETLRNDTAAAAAAMRDVQQYVDSQLDDRVTKTIVRVQSQLDARTTLIEQSAQQALQKVDDQSRRTSSDFKLISSMLHERSAALSKQADDLVADRKLVIQMLIDVDKKTAQLQRDRRLYSQAVLRAAWIAGASLVLVVAYALTR